jgi:hypothetical protein
MICVLKLVESCAARSASGDNPKPLTIAHLIARYSSPYADKFGQVEFLKHDANTQVERLARMAEVASSFPRTGARPSRLITPVRIFIKVDFAGSFFAKQAHVFHLAATEN